MVRRDGSITSALFNSVLGISIMNRLIFSYLKGQASLWQLRNIESYFAYSGWFSPNKSGDRGFTEFLHQALLRAFHSKAKWVRV